MRTTLTLDDEIYQRARQIAFDERRAIGDVISDLAQAGLNARRAQAPARRLGFWQGKGWVADDFDDTPQEWLDAIDEPL